jgi:hypothetical protein
MHTYPPPVGYEAPTSFSFNAAADWQRLVAEGFQPDSYEGTDTSLRTMRGDCLSPLIIEGQHATVSRPLGPNERLVDGGLYVIEWDIENEVAEAGRKLREKYGLASTDKIVIAKFLRYLCGTWYIHCNEALAPLHGTVIAKVIRIEPLERTAGSTAQMAAGAITQVVNSTLSSLTSASLTGTTAAPASNVSMDSLAITTLTNSPVNVVCTSLPDASGDQVNSSVTGFQVSYTVWRNGVNINAPVATFSHQNTTWAAGSTIHTPPVTFDFVDPSPGIGYQLYSLRCSVTPSGTGGSITAHRDSICWSLMELKK